MFLPSSRLCGLYTSLHDAFLLPVELLDVVLGVGLLHILFLKQLYARLELTLKHTTTSELTSSQTLLYTLYLHFITPFY